MRDITKFTTFFYARLWVWENFSYINMRSFFRCAWYFRSRMTTVNSHTILWNTVVDITENTSHWEAWRLSQKGLMRQSYAITGWVKSITLSQRHHSFWWYHHKLVLEKSDSSRNGGQHCNDLTEGSETTLNFKISGGLSYRVR